jgi:hypothetical protein
MKEFMYAAVCKCGHMEASHSADLFTALMGKEMCPKCGTPIEGSPFHPVHGEPFSIRRVVVKYRILRPPKIEVLPEEEA